MTIECIVRSWKDEEYRASLSPAELALLPGNPAGLIELNNVGLQKRASEELEAPTGASLTLGCCTGSDGACSGTYFFASIGCCPSAYYPCSEL